MKIYSLLLVILWGVSIPAAPSDTSSCNSPEARQFDFWIGSWDINQKILRQDGSWIELKASTTVSPLLNGCALEEHWTGQVQFFWLGMTHPEEIKGFSLRYFDTSSGKWNIYWMDTQNPDLGKPFTGNFSEDKGEFYASRETKKGKQISRIVFSDIKEYSVHWDLSISNDDGKNWKAIWVMDMQRKL